MGFEFAPDNRPVSVGAYLKKVRLEKELSLSDISQQIKVHEKYLTAIEEDLDSVFPDLVYKELFVKSYAEFFGISADDFRLRAPEATPSPTEGEAQAKEAVTPAPGQQTREQLRSTPPPRVVPTRGNRKRIGVAVSVLFVIAAAIVGFYAWEKGWIKIGEKSEPQPVPATIPDTMMEPQAETKPDSSIVGLSDSLFFLFIGRFDCWLQVQTDTISAFTGMIGPGDTLRFATGDSIYVKLGRANAVDGWVNGLPLRLADPHDSAVIVIQISRDNYMSFLDSGRMVQ